MAKTFKVKSESQLIPSHKKVIGRLNRVSGQVEGIKKMIEEGRYCPDILIQIKAVRSALKGVEAKILESHLQSCVLESFRSSNDLERKKKVDELLEIFGKYT